MSSSSRAVNIPALLAGAETQPHARAVLLASLPPVGQPSHAYLFHGPAGSGKRALARAFAAALLSDGAGDPAAVSDRVARDCHPDLTWVRPSGAAEMLVSDIELPVVAAATRTPFESRRRVFVVESADSLNEQAANRLLKTLEEPPSFVHLILLAPRLQDVLATIVSRCQPVRFDPIAREMIERRLLSQTATVDLDGDRASACARLSLGDVGVAEALAREEGAQLRDASEAFVRSALHGRTAERRWGGLLGVARAAGAAAAELVQCAGGEELELLPSKERRRAERETLEAARRSDRRARTQALDLGLRLAELWLRDLACILEGAPELVHGVDRRSELEHDARDGDAVRIRAGVDLVADTRLRLALNVSEELALEALAYRLQSLLAPEL